MAKKITNQSVVRPMSDAEKHDAIVQACATADFDQLVRLADTPGGFLNDELRQLSWPTLLGCGSEGARAEALMTPWQKLPAHAEEEQVQRDVDRAFVYYPANEPARVVDARKKMLYDLIIRVLRTHPMLCYFQGYHDIVQVLLLVLGDRAAFEAVERISLLRIRDFMLPSLSPAVKHLRLIPCILRAADRQLADHLSFTPPYFALSWTLTLYAHDIQEYSDIARLFDFILAHEPVMSIYLFAAIIISRREELLEIPPDDHDMLHFTLSKLPQKLDLESWISGALLLFQTHPPEHLPGSIWRSLSSSSVLKTSRNIDKPRSLKEGEICFRRQAQEVRREQFYESALKLTNKYKRPIASTLMAVLVGALSFYLRRSGKDKTDNLIDDREDTFHELSMYNIRTAMHWAVVFSERPEMKAWTLTQGLTAGYDSGYIALSTHDHHDDFLKAILNPPPPGWQKPRLIVKMANRGYDVVVDVDTEGDLGHTDLQDDDLEFHSSNFETNPRQNRKVQPDSTPFLSNSTTNPANLPNDPSAIPSKHMLWSLPFYAQFFDVDTSTVFYRCRSALLPFIPNTPPFLDTLDGNPDLYGPFWIATTVVVILFLTGTISHKLATENKKHFEYDFKLLSGAAGLIYGYTAFVPLGLWAALRWFGAQSLELVECWALYGYSNLFWIIVALVSWSPLDGLNYALVGLGYGVSVFFLVKNLYPVISATEKKISQILLLAVVLIHAGLAIAIKILFFSHNSPAKKDAESKMLLF